MSTQDFIFCPFCGSIRWTTDKSGYAQKGRLERNTCAGCHKFHYVNHLEHTTSSSGLEIFCKKRYSVEATIDPYIIKVNYLEARTEFQDLDTYQVILTLDTAITFNWYKNEELVDKIKKYVLFS